MNRPDPYRAVEHLDAHLWEGVSKQRRRNVLSMILEFDARDPRLIPDHQAPDLLRNDPFLTDEEEVAEIRKVLEADPARFENACWALKVQPIHFGSTTRKPARNRTKSQSRRARIRALENVKMHPGWLRRMPFTARRPPDWWNAKDGLEYEDVYGDVQLNGLWPKKNHLRLVTGMAVLSQLSSDGSPAVRCSLSDIALAGFHEENLWPARRRWIKETLIAYSNARIRMTTRPEKPSDNHGGRLEVPCSPIVSVKAFSAQTGELMPLQELERLGHRVAPVDQPFEVTLADWFFTATQGEKKRQGFSYMLIDRNELRALPARLIGTWSTVISLSPRDTVEGFRKVKKWWFYVSPAMAMMFGRFQHLSAHLGHIDRAEPRRIEREIREDLEQLAEITKTIGTTTWGPSKTRPNGYTHFYVTVPKDGKNRLYGLKDPSASPSSFLSRIEFRKILNQTNRAAHIYSHLKASLRWKLPGVTKPTSTPGGQDASPDEIRTLIRDQFDGGDSQPTRAGPFPAFS